MMQFAFVALAIAAGVLAGSIFYGGLWWTVQRLKRVKHPALLVLGSFSIRIIATLIVFYGVISLTGHLLYLGLSLVSFTVVRIILINQIRPSEERKIRATES